MRLDDDELTAFRSELRSFATTRLRPWYQHDDREGRLHDGVVEEMAALGLLGLRIAEEHGGQGADCVTTGVACEEVARADFNAAYLVLMSALCADILQDHADDEQAARWLPPIASGEVVTSLCLTEPEHGSDAAALRCRAQRDGDGWRLSGEKTSISLGTFADTGIVFARTGDAGARGITAFYATFDDQHLERHPFVDLGSRAIGRASLHFDDLWVDDRDRIGEVGEGFVQVMRGFDYSRALIALMCLAAASASVDEAFDHARDREAFGRPIGTFQGVSFPLVEYATQLRGARLLSYDALSRKDQGLDHTVEANMVKWWAPKLAVDAAHQALLTFGHAGYSEELPLAQRVRDLIGLEIGDGTAQVAKLVVARQLLGRTASP